MKIECKDLERVLREQEPPSLEALARHAESCAGCARELRLWNEISAAAGHMRKSWDSPGLWPRIQQALVAQSHAAADGQLSGEALAAGCRDCRVPRQHRAEPLECPLAARAAGDLPAKTAHATGCSPGGMNAGERLDAPGNDSQCCTYRRSAARPARRNAGLDREPGAAGR